MTNLTKRAIKDTFMQQLEQKPLKKITVKDIVTACGINRNSFYYHYRDLPDLIEEIITEFFNETIKKYPNVNSFVECFDALISYITEHKRSAMHIYRSVNREAFEKYLMRAAQYFVHNYINTALKEEPISEADKQTVETYYKCVMFGLAIDWLECGLEDSYIENMRRILEIKTDFALEISAILKNQI